MSSKILVKQKRKANRDNYIQSKALVYLKAHQPFKSILHIQKVNRLKMVSLIYTANH
jgi:hypothetical protein